MQRMFTEDQVRLLVQMIIDYCEAWNGNGIKGIPVDTVIHGVAAGKNPGDGDGPSGYGYIDKISEWEAEDTKERSP